MAWNGAAISRPVVGSFLPCNFRDLASICKQSCNSLAKQDTTIKSKHKLHEIKICKKSKQAQNQNTSCTKSKYQHKICCSPENLVSLTMCHLHSLCRFLLNLTSYCFWHYKSSTAAHLFNSGSIRTPISTKSIQFNPRMRYTEMEQVATTPSILRAILYFIVQYLSGYKLNSLYIKQVCQKSSCNNNYSLKLNSQQ